MNTFTLNPLEYAQFILRNIPHLCYEVCDGTIHEYVVVLSSIEMAAKSNSTTCWMEHAMDVEYSMTMADAGLQVLAGNNPWYISTNGYDAIRDYLLDLCDRHMVEAYRHRLRMYYAYD